MTNSHSNQESAEAPKTPVQGDGLRDIIGSIPLDYTTTLDEATEPLYAEDILGNAGLIYLDKLEAAIQAQVDEAVRGVLERLIAQEWSFGEKEDARAVPTRYLKHELEQLRKNQNDSVYDSTTQSNNRKEKSGEAKH